MGTFQTSPSLLLLSPGTGVKVKRLSSPLYAVVAFTTHVQRVVTSGSTVQTLTQQRLGGGRAAYPWAVADQ